MRVLMYDAIISVDDDCYMVEGYSERKKMKEGYAYLMRDGYVYPYQGKYDHILSNKSGLYYKGKEIVLLPHKRENIDWYEEDRIIELDPREIIMKINSEPDGFANDETVEEALSNGDMLIPVIKESDDFLKYLVKRIILVKGFSRSANKKKFSKSHELPNLIQSLEKDTKMTVTNFKRWVELLDVEWAIDVWNRDDTSHKSVARVSSDDY